MQRDTNTNAEITAIIEILDAFYHIGQKNYEMAVLKLVNINIQEAEDPSDQNKSLLAEVCTPTDLAFYICICALLS